MSVDQEAELVSISPYGIPALNKSISSILKPLPYINDENSASPAPEDEQAAVSLPGVSIPVLKNASILKLVEANNSKLKSSYRAVGVQSGSSSHKGTNDIKNGTKKASAQTAAGSTSANIASSEVTTSLGDDMDVDIDDAEPRYYYPISDFVPSNLQEQLTTLAIKDLPGVKKSVIEKAISLLIADSGSRATYKWSSISFDFTEHRLIFVRFDSIQGLHLFLKSLSGVGQYIPGLKGFVDPRVEEHLPKDDEREAVATPTGKHVAEVGRILKNPRNLDSSKNSGTEDLDAVMSYYSSYKVEESELVDVPTDMRSGIVKGIIEFRSKVLKLEKERRKNEIERERQKAKLKLKQLFQNIQENISSSSSDPVSDSKSRVDENAGEDTPVPDEYDELSDAKYDELMEKKRKADLDLTYSNELKKMKAKEDFEKNALERKLVTLKAYESNLMENKLKYIDEFKNFVDYDYKSAKFSGGLNSTVRLYYTNHSEYLRLRTKEREREEKLDQADEAEEEAQREAKPTVSAATPIAVSIGSSAVASTPTPTATVTATATATATPTATSTTVIPSAPSASSVSASISTLPADKLASLKDKISNLIEEYLGLKEESLIEFVYEHLLEKNLTDRDGLTEELSETLDEDAAVVVDELWKFISEI